MSAHVLLTERWYPLIPHAASDALYKSTARFIVGVAGRRSGKSEKAKRKLVKRAMKCRTKNGRFVYCAPIRDQAKEIAWQDLKDLVPLWAVRSINESSLTIYLIHGPKIQVIGMDKPHRSEGGPIDGGVMDEYADMKEEAFTRSVSPSLDTIGRPGWCLFIGKPKGRNHFFDLFQSAHVSEDWEAYHWPSSDLLTPKAIEAARARMDELSFEQEYNASFVNFEGRVYYPFDRLYHTEIALRSRFYEPRAPLMFCFDFNVEPGVAVIAQDIYHPKLGGITACIGEVYIPNHSNTQRVCRKLIADWKTHEGDVLLYGDATGGARGSAKILGSDWDLIKQELRPVFGERLKTRVPRENPEERIRVNAVNRRLRTVDGKIHMLVDLGKCKNLVADLEGVTVLEGSNGEIDKKSNPKLTHLTDALGYCIVKRHPMASEVVRSEGM